MKSVRHDFIGRLSEFARDQRGGIAPFIAGGIFVMVGAMGLATDAARGYLVQARLSQALDAAALAGGKSGFESGTPDEALIRQYFNSNFPAGYLGAQLMDPDNPTTPMPTAPKIEVVDNGERVQVTAVAEIPTTFMRVFGQETMKVHSSAEATQQTQQLEAVLAIDMSGSMAYAAPDGGSRIQAARDASKDLVNILFGANTTNSLLNIGIVPWNHKVNVSINGSTYDPTATIAVATSAFTNPLTGQAQSEVYYANNSPVPLLRKPPGNAIAYAPSGSFYLEFNNNSTADWIRRSDGKNWEEEGYTVGGTITITNAESSSNNGTFNISNIDNNKLYVEKYDLSGDSVDTHASATGTYQWLGCVYARYMPNPKLGMTYKHLTNDVWAPAGSETWVPATVLTPYTSDANQDFDDDADLVFGATSVGGVDWPAWEPITGEGEPVATGYRCLYSYSNAECSPCLHHGITPLTDEKQELLDALDELVNPEGGTNIVQGLAWAWRLLLEADPFPNSIEPPPNGLRQRAIVILTDGENNGWVADGYKGVWGLNAEAQGYVSSDPGYGGSVKKMDARLEQLGQQLRDQGILVYTIQFAYQNSHYAELLKKVAHEPNSPYYHYAPDAATLQTVFRTVANHLAQLRISK